MSRIGKLPVEVPSGVEVELAGSTVDVKGPKGRLSQGFSEELTIRREENLIYVERPSDEPRHRSLHGLTRTLISNMVTGVSEGYTKTLEVVGVGYKFNLKGNLLEIMAGFSHPVNMEAPEGIEFEVPMPTRLIIKGYDKQAVGHVAALIRKIRPPEPYKGKGIKYQGEHIRRKVGKTAK